MVWELLGFDSYGGSCAELSDTGLDRCLNIECSPLVESLLLAVQ